MLPVPPECLWRIFADIDYTSKVVFAALHPPAKRLEAADFLRRVLEKLPCRVHTVLTDKGGSSLPSHTRFFQVATALAEYIARLAWSIA